jgi:hypothetical protein
VATKTLGTNANNTLTAVNFSKALSAADIAAIANAILDDRSPDSGQPANAAPSAKPIWRGAFSLTGLLYIPNRGVLQVLPGDWVGVDANGWPILLSANAIAGGTTPSAATSWTHS